MYVENENTWLHNTNNTTLSEATNNLQPRPQNAIIIQYDANRSRANVYARLVAFCISGSIQQERWGVVC